MTVTYWEEKLGIITKILRFTDYKRATPFSIEIKTASGEKVLAITRGVALFLSTVQVFDENDALVGKFKQKLFSIGGKFDVLYGFDIGTPIFVRALIDQKHARHTELVEVSSTAYAALIADPG